MNDGQLIKPKRGRRSKKDILAAAAALAEVDAESLTSKKENNIEDSNIKIEIEEAHAVAQLVEVVEVAQSVSVEAETEENEKLEEATKNISDENVILKPGVKKRGRKPKGGKIIVQNLQTNSQKETKQNVILHLKCSIKDLELNGDYNSNLINPNIESYNFSYNKNELHFDVINSNNATKIEELSNNENYVNDNEMELELSNDKSQCDKKEIWRKLKTLEQNLHLNNIPDKKSACFWCSYDFDNPPIHIPKHFIKNSYSVYGCFCTPECAVAYLMSENIDSSTKFERYGLINHVYSKIYEYKKNIKPAPDPYYMLERFYGPLTIQEYRSLLKTERLFLIVDKPLTRILPEFHEDNDDFIIHHKIIPSNNYQIKKNKDNKKIQQTKSNIVNEKFGIISN
jgi:hypothetical protein